MIVDTEKQRSVVLTDEQIRLYESMTKLRKDVALNSLAGMKPAEAHRAAGGKCKDESRRTNLASEILLNPAVAEFLASFKVPPSQEMASAVMSRDEMIAGLTTIARTNINDVMSFSERPVMDVENGLEMLMSVIHIRNMDEMPPGAMQAIKSVKQTKNGLEVTLYDSLAARKQIAEMCGYDAAIKQEVTVVKTLAEFYGR